MRHSRFLLLALIAFAAFDVSADLPPAGGAGQPVLLNGTTEEASIRSGMGLDGYALTYKEADGTVLNFDQFSAGLATGRAFSILKDTDSKRAVLALDAADASRELRAAPGAIKPGMALPSYLGRDLAGRAFDSASLRGQATLLSFHFADCVPCIAEVPMLNAIADANPALRVHAVTFDDATTAQGFVDQHGFDWPVLPDAQAFIDAMGVKVYPTLVLVDAGGVVRALAPGALEITDESTLQAWIDRTLAPPAE